MSAPTTDSGRQAALKPLSTEMPSAKSIDSAVAMSAESNVTKLGNVHDSTLRTNEALQLDADQASTPLKQADPNQDTNQKTNSDIADLVRSLQRVLSNSKANISVNIDPNATARLAEPLSAPRTHSPGEAIASYNASPVNQSAVDSTPAENSSVKKGDGTCQPSSSVQDTLTERKPVSYAVEYLDRFSHLVSKDIRTSEYDFESERQKSNSDRYSSGFTITTVIRTSLAPSEPGVLPFDRDEPKREDLLKSKDVTMGFYTIKLTITSPAILDVLRKNAFYYPDLPVWNDQLTLTSPFSDLAHHLSLLEQERDSLKGNKDNDSTTHQGQDQPAPPVESQCRSAISNSDAVDHLTLLLEYLGKAYKKRIEDEERRISKGRCTFAMLWYLFRPGMTVYVHSDDDAEDPPTAMVVRTVTVDPEILYRHDDQPEPCSIELWYLDFDGYCIGRGLCLKDIKPFDGEKQITDLMVVPCRFMDEKDKEKALDDKGFVTTRDRLVRLGRKWFDLLKGKMVFYNGQFIDGPDTDAVSTLSTDYLESV